MSPRRRERHERVRRALLARRIDARRICPERWFREQLRARHCAVTYFDFWGESLPLACEPAPRQVGRIVSVDHERGSITYVVEDAP